MAQRRLAKGDQARRRVLDAAIEAIARQGLAALSVADIGREVGMSSGHVLYYFGTKDTLFVEALRHIEESLDQGRAALLASEEPALPRLRRFLDLYLPTGRHDARWSLWVQVWSGSLTDPELGAVQARLDARWREDLAELIDSGVEAGEFEAGDSGEVAAAITAMLDGLAIRLMTGDEEVESGSLAELAERACRLLVRSR